MVSKDYGFAYVDSDDFGDIFVFIWYCRSFDPDTCWMGDDHGFLSIDILTS